MGATIRKAKYIVQYFLPKYLNYLYIYLSNRSHTGCNAVSTYLPMCHATNRRPLVFVRGELTNLD